MALEGPSLVHPYRARSRTSVELNAEARVGPVPSRHAPMTVQPVGVLTTSLAEARCWRRRRAPLPAVAFATGASSQRAQQDARRLLEQGVSGLVSFGLALGLAPALRPGDLVVATSVVLPSGAALPADEAWRQALLDTLADLGCRVTVARVAGGERLDLSVTEKRRLFMTAVAAAIDTESAAVAESARAAGVPFLVVRAIADPAEEARPFAALAGLRADGRRRALALTARLLARPGEIAAMWRFAQSSRMGLGALRPVAAVMPAPPKPVAVAAASPEDRVPAWNTALQPQPRRVQSIAIGERIEPVAPTIGAGL